MGHGSVAELWGTTKVQCMLERAHADGIWSGVSCVMEEVGVLVSISPCAAICIEVVLYFEEDDQIHSPSAPHHTLPITPKPKPGI